MKRILAVVISAGLVLGLGAAIVYAQGLSAVTPETEQAANGFLAGASRLTVQAQDSTPSPNPSESSAPQHHCNERINETLADLAEKGTITQKQADSVANGVVERLSKLQTQRFDPQTMASVLADTLKDAVADKTITQAQADAVTSAVEANRPAFGTRFPRFQPTQQPAGFSV